MLSNVDPWNTSIYHTREGGIAKSAQKITVWHREACQEMANGDFEGQICHVRPSPKGWIFFLFTIQLCIFVLK